jgi:hypothetical protein
LNILRKIAQGTAETKFGSKALNEKIDLNAFKAKPSAKAFLGILLIGLSFIIGWPMIGLFGAFSLYWNEPLILIAGGPFLFILSHLASLAGVYLAGGKYIMPLIRLATRVRLKKLI